MSLNADPARLERVLAVLAPDDAAWVAQQLGDAAWRARERRLATRDAAIRQMLPILTADSPCRAATELAQMLGGYIRSISWRADESTGTAPADAHASRHLLFAIAIANEGKALGWRQILRVMQGERTPPLS